MAASFGRRFVWRTRPIAIAAALLVAVAVQGCGGANDQHQIEASVRAYYTALAKRNVNAACRMVTPTFWSGCTFPQAIVIPPGDYFVIGDNRGNSEDSRYWGPVKRAWIVGVVKR